MKLIFASSNKKKLEEIKALLSPSVDLLSLADVNITEDIPETGDTFKANALLKAKYVLNKTGINCFADDSGLEVDALDMRPGIYSARYAGQIKSSEDNIDLLLEELKDKENRKAQFCAVVALLINGGTYFFEGVVRGSIIQERRGNNGFGYDPVFVADGYEKTFAELSPEEKNKISHRAIAIKQLVQFLKKI